MIILRDSKIEINNSEAITKVLQDLLRAEDKISQEQERFYVVHLDTRNKINLVEMIALGSINSMNLQPREVFRRAITEGTVSLIIAHNHPSGDVEPSRDDIRTTRQLHEAGELLCIPVVDHLVFTTEKAYSFRKNGCI